MAEHNAGIGYAAHFGRFDKFFALQAQGLPTHNPRHVQPRHHADGNKNKAKITTEKGYQQNHEKHKRKSIENLEKTHHQHIGFAAEKAGNRAVNHADHHRHQSACRADHQGNASADGHAGEQIPAQRIGAEIMLVFHGRRRLHCAPIGVIVGKRRNQRCHRHKQADGQQDQAAGECGAVATEAPPGVLPQAACFDVGTVIERGSQRGGVFFIDQHRL